MTRTRSTADSRREALISAHFKLDAATHFIDSAASSHGSAREFRYLFDAASEALCSARDLITVWIGRDRGVRQRLADACRGSECFTVINQLRHDAHHEGPRATLTEEVRGGSPMLVTSVHIDAVEGYRGKALLDDTASSGLAQSRRWIIEYEGKEYPAVETCREVIRLLRSFLK